MIKVDATSSFKTVVEVCYYDNVEISKADLPPHIIEWARGDDAEMTDYEVSDTIPYFRVTSDQGSFGIAIAAYNLIDLKDTGFNALDLGEVDATEDFFLASLNTATLNHLRWLMTKKMSIRKTIY